MDERSARQGLLDAARRLDASGLNVNASGNLSVRAGDRLLVTPSGIPPDAMTTDDCVLLDADGTPLDPGGRTPSSEWRLHLEVYRRRSDVAAIVHTHSPEATAAATHRRPVPAVHYVIARFGGVDLACAPYATYGTAELAEAVADTLGTRRAACLMANHGAIAVAADLPAAISLALDIEWLCGVHRRAVAHGTPQALSDDEITRVAARFATYGQPSGDERSGDEPSARR